MRPALNFFLSLWVAFAFSSAQAATPINAPPCPAASIPKRQTLLLTSGLNNGCLTITQLRRPEFPKQLRVTVTDLLRNRRWSRAMEGNLFPEPIQGEDWGTDQQLLWLEVTVGWEMWQKVNIGLDIQTGKVLWKAAGTLRLQTKDFFFVQHFVATSPYQDLKTMTFEVIDRKTLARAVRDYLIPDRPGCGDTSDFVREDAAYIESWLDTSFLYARRKDACGVFVARFDWRSDQPLLPIITTP
ncbi:MAG: hypothetical protein JWQ08_2861 [Deinococcus sp.]|nr:hypothetical protein [Deinococcus sp.]